MNRTFGTGYSSQAGFEKISQSSVACAGTGRRKTDAKARLSAELAKDLILTFPPYVFLKLTSRFESCDFHVSQMTLPNKLLPRSGHFNKKNCPHSAQEIYGFGGEGWPCLLKSVHTSPSAQER
jgi:hypothetical protein